VQEVCPNRSLEPFLRQGFGIGQIGRSARGADRSQGEFGEGWFGVTTSSRLAARERARLRAAQRIAREQLARQKKTPDSPPAAPAAELVDDDQAEDDE
jgi:hypothetical protein